MCSSKLESMNRVNSVCSGLVVGDGEEVVVEGVEDAVSREGHGVACHTGDRQRAV